MIADNLGVILFSGVREVKGDCFVRSVVWHGGDQACDDRKTNLFSF
jgi:hypothetical protein